MAREFGRKQRVADYLRQELQTSMRDPRIGMVSVNEVEVSRDLAHAKVFVTFMEADSEAAAREPLEVLSGAAGYLRTEVARDARMRSVPRLHFVYDASVMRGRLLSDLIDRAVAADDTLHDETGGES